jgi:hypothetical protein
MEHQLCPSTVAFTTPAAGGFIREKSNPQMAQIHADISAACLDGSIRPEVSRAGSPSRGINLALSADICVICGL